MWYPFKSLYNDAVAYHDYRSDAALHQLAWARNGAALSALSLTGAFLLDPGTTVSLEEAVTKLPYIAGVGGVAGGGIGMTVKKGVGCLIRAGFHHNIKYEIFAEGYQFPTYRPAIKGAIVGTAIEVGVQFAQAAEFTVGENTALYAAVGAGFAALTAAVVQVKGIMDGRRGSVPNAQYY